MANTQSMCASFKTELLNGYHNFTSSNPARTINTADTFKAALYTTAATMNNSATAYTSLNEVTNGAGTGYTATGEAFLWTTPSQTISSITASTAFSTPTASLIWSSFTSAASFDCVMTYNATNGGRAISVHTFGSQSVTAGTFTLTMPSNAAGTALINLA